jgi:hypothetical protein
LGRWRSRPHGNAAVERLSGHLPEDSDLQQQPCRLPARGLVAAQPVGQGRDLAGRQLVVDEA